MLQKSSLPLQWFSFVEVWYMLYIYSKCQMLSPVTTSPHCTLSEHVRVPWQGASHYDQRSNLRAHVLAASSTTICGCEKTDRNCSESSANVISCFSPTPLQPYAGSQRYPLAAWGRHFHSDIMARAHLILQPLVCHIFQIKSQSAIS